MLPTSSAATPAKKPLIRRLTPDRSQQIRRAVQLAFLALNAWIAVEFLIWVRYFESNGQTPYIARPAPHLGIGEPQKAVSHLCACLSFITPRHHLNGTMASHSFHPKIRGLLCHVCVSPL